MAGIRQSGRRLVCPGTGSAQEADTGMRNGRTEAPDVDPGLLLSALGAVRVARECGPRRLPLGV